MIKNKNDAGNMTEKTEMGKPAPCISLFHAHRFHRVQTFGNSALPRRWMIPYGNVCFGLGMQFGYVPRESIRCSFRFPCVSDLPLFAVYLLWPTVNQTRQTATHVPVDTQTKTVCNPLVLTKLILSPAMPPLWRIRLHCAAKPCV